LFGWDWMYCLVGIGCIVWLGLDVLFGWDWLHPVREDGWYITNHPHLFLSVGNFSYGSVRPSPAGRTEQIMPGKEANISLLGKVVASVLARVAEIEGCRIEDLLGEVKVVKPTPSDPTIIFRGRVIVWWL
jgi:hypothetical protein